MDKLEIVKGGVRRGQQLSLYGSGKGVISRKGIAANVETLLSCGDIFNPVLIITEDEAIRASWASALQERSIIAVVVDMATAEALLEHARVEQWVIVFDDLGEGQNDYAKFAPRVRAIVARLPRLVLGVAQLSANSSIDELVKRITPLKQPAEFSNELRLDYIKSSQVKLHIVNDTRLIAVLIDVAGSIRAWPEYAVRDNTVYRRGATVTLDSSMGDISDIFGAREYQVVGSVRNDPDSFSNAEGVKRLMNALVF